MTNTIEKIKKEAYLVGLNNKLSSITAEGFSIAEDVYDNDCENDIEKLNRIIDAYAKAILLNEEIAVVEKELKEME